jgi:transposase
MDLGYTQGMTGLPPLPRLPGQKDPELPKLPDIPKPKAPLVFPPAPPKLPRMDLSVKLPKLMPGDMVRISNEDALKYLRQEYGTAGLDNADVYEIIKRYRDGQGVRQIAKEVAVSTSAVNTWTRRAEELHILSIRRPGSDAIEKAVTAKAISEANTAALVEKKVDADIKMAERLREKAQQILESVDERSIKEAKLKDKVGSAVQLLTIERLITNKSTVNTSHRSVVEHITRLNSMTVAEKMRLIENRGAPEEEPADGDTDES